jgi:hypothetical protein
MRRFSPPIALPIHLRRAAALLAAAAITPGIAAAGTLVALTFDAPLSTLSPASSAASTGATATHALMPAGTVDAYMENRTQALVLQADFSKVSPSKAASAQVSTGRMSVSNQEADLAKLTVSFDVKVNTLNPVKLIVSSYDAQGKFTGSRAATVTPPVAASYYRFGIDLDKTAPVKGKFDPLAPQVEFSFEISDVKGLNPLPREVGNSLMIDNISYTAPSYYVSPTGNDNADGKTAATAFATPQRAADVAQAGDVVLLMNGTYTSTGKTDISHIPDEVVNKATWRPWWVDHSSGNLAVKQAGKPAEWIVFRNHPGHKPHLYNDGGWYGVKFEQTASYIEVRGLHIEGIRNKLSVADALVDGGISEKDGRWYHGAARFNGNGILADGRPGKTPDQRPHHLRMIDNVVYDHAGAGITLLGIEYVTIEGNITSGNCNMMRYGSSGISTLLTWDWDKEPGHKIFIVRNTSHSNQTFVPTGTFEQDANGKVLPRKLTDRYTDGNGIIVDVNRNNATSKHVDYAPYAARTLVQNNLVYNNGGGGIHTVKAHHVDIINNTAYMNSVSPKIEYTPIGGYEPVDVNVYNNIIVSPVANTAAGEKPERLNQPSTKTSSITYANNLYFGGNLPPVMGIGDRIGDPKFVNANVDPKKADFRLKPDSPAIAAGTRTISGVPINDINGSARTNVSAPDLGAYSH